MLCHIKTGEGLLRLPPGLAAPAEPLAVRVGAVTVPALPHRPGAAPGVVELPASLGDLVPEALPCRVRLEGRTLLIGPVVGIIGGRNPAELTPRRLEAMGNHLLVQGRRGGLFIVTDRESIDTAGRRVTGFHLRPGGGWTAGRYPLPAVLFRRYGVGVDPLLAGLRAAGVQLFNERIFHKGEAARWMESDPLLRPHLPETAPLTGPEAVLALLERHETVFAKPNWGSLAGGIVRVRRAPGGFACEPSRGEPIACATAADLAPHLPRGGLVQQGLVLAAAGGRMIDFRAVVQKDGCGQWQVSGIVGRCGEAGLFVSNMATGGFPLSVEDGLSLLFGTGPAELFRRKQELERLARRAAQALEAGSGLLLGDLGLDLAYDRQLHPWVIEANNRDPDHNIGWEASDWPLFYRFRTLPLEYACHLAGFGEGGLG